ncbi:MFS transporter [Spiractinospora alimapuensis]|uniref:MFS transporter n=1 Tax=Spiractinospora alimapuensis TaxID=2820884 RepID=UPI001F2EB7F2|nr:MFS transporter [Spiractinospora alimapuensis]QVQ52656.1 MFS transporter [Spiractinospora alimapuensis]
MNHDADRGGARTPQPSPTDGSDTPTVPPDPRRWWALAVIGLVQLMVVLDATIVNIALPSAQADLAISDGDRHWVITAYVLALGSLLLLGGRVADQIGVRRALLIGLVGFAAASILGGAAPTGGILFAARAGQGVSAALVAPAALSLLSVLFTDPRERGTAFGIYGALSGGGAAVGLLAGGLLTEYLDWRWCLYVNVPIAVLAAAGAVAFVRAGTQGPRGRVDLPGAVLSCVGLASIVLGIAQAEERGWTSSTVIALIGVGVIVLLLLVVVETRTVRPLVPLRVLTHRARGGSFLAVALSQVALFGFFLFMTYYMQGVLGYTPIQAGLAFLPLTAATAVGASVVAARLLHRTGPRVLVVSGLLLTAGGMGALTRLSADADMVYLTLLLPTQLAIGLGMGLVMMPAMSTATASVAPADAGVAAALVNTSQHVGGALGAALLNTVAASATASLAVGGRGTGVEAVVHGYTTGIATAVAVLLATAVVAFVLLPRRPGAAQGR